MTSEMQQSQTIPVNPPQNDIAIDTAEMQLLLACVPGSWRDEQRFRVAELIPQIRSWEAVPQLAVRHRMVPQVAWTLNRCGCDVPSEIEAELRTRNQRWAMRRLSMISELRRTGDAFADADIAVGVFKGPAVERMVYEPSQLRQYNDLDLVVKPSAVRDACDVLSQLGYAGFIDQLRDFSTAELRRLIKHYRDASCSRVVAGRVLSVELHWSLCDLPRRHTAFEESIWQSLNDAPESIYGTLSGVDLLIYLAFHGGRHRWKRLTWLCDFVRAMDRFDDGDWKTAFDRAEQLRLRSYLDLALLIVDRLLPFHSIPAGAKPLSSADRFTSAISRCQHAIVADEMYYETKPLSSFRWLFELPHSPTDRLAGFSQLFIPTNEDFLANGWWKGHYQRCLRVGGKLFRRAG